jgi:hypothetical protein
MHNIFVSDFTAYKSPFFFGDFKKGGCFFISQEYIDLVCRKPAQALYFQKGDCGTLKHHMPRKKG